MTSAMAGGGAEGVPDTPVLSEASAAARARHRASNLLIRASDGMFAWITKPSVREFLAELIGTFILIVSNRVYFFSLFLFGLFFGLFYSLVSLFFKINF